MSGGYHHWACGPLDCYVHGGHVVNVSMVVKHNQLPEEDDTMGSTTADTSTLIYAAYIHCISLNDYRYGLGSGTRHTLNRLLSTFAALHCTLSVVCLVISATRCCTGL